MANAKKSTKKVVSKKTVTAKTVAKKTVIAKAANSTRGRMPAWVAKAPRFAKDYVLTMRAAGKTYDAKGYKVWRSAIIAKAKSIKAKKK
jgi:hypothetical protein